jgi:hypothetical protein
MNVRRLASIERMLKIYDTVHSKPGAKVADLSRVAEIGDNQTIIYVRHLRHLGLVETAKPMLEGAKAMILVYHVVAL